jgi:hypothetical protein
VRGPLSCRLWRRPANCQRGAITGLDLGGAGAEPGYTPSSGSQLNTSLCALSLIPEQ